MAVDSRVGAAPAGDAWPAPAKLNLFLHITGRRADGYHELQTLFSFLDYCDALTFALRADGVIARTSPSEIAETEDLVVRAAGLLQRVAGVSQGVDIHIDKRLPVGGGLGGGSSNAATTLVALNQRWACGLSTAELAALGLELGADVPVFIYGRAAWAEGIGERLTPMRVVEPWYLVVKPPIEVATATLFGAPELTRDCKPITIESFVNGYGQNVFEPVARRYYPALDRLLDWLNRHAAGRMTGTGSCVYAPFETREEAEALIKEAPAGSHGVVARGLNASPLLARLAREAGAPHRCIVY